MSPGGISMMTPSDRLISVGSPQPSLAIGPIRNVPCCGGKNACRSLMIRGALATTFCGNMMLSIASVRTPSISGWKSIDAVQPEQPADRQQREAEAELDAGAEIGGDDDQQREPAEPSGILVVISPIACRLRKSAKTSCSAPA